MTSHVVKEKYPWVAVKRWKNKQAGSALHPNEHDDDVDGSTMLVVM